MSTLKWLMLRILSAVNCLFFLDYVNEASLERWFVYMQWVRRRWFYFYRRNAVAKDKNDWYFSLLFRYSWLWRPLFVICWISNLESQSMRVSESGPVLCALVWEQWWIFQNFSLWDVEMVPTPSTSTSTNYEYNVFSSVPLSQISL